MNDPTDDPAVDRRTVIRGAGTIGVTALVAGCGGGGGSDGSDGDRGDGEGGGGGSDGDSGDTETPTATPAGDGGDGGNVPAGVEEYLSDVGNFDGVEDMTGNSEVTVQVGVEANGGNFGFGPAAIRVDAGTTVVWEWTGQGGQHNVVDEDGNFESELVEEEGHTFEYTFDEASATRYYCLPHKGMGMKGAVLVE